MSNSIYKNQKIINKPKIDPVKLAYKQSKINWDSVKSLSERVVYPDTMAYIDSQLKANNIPELLRNVILGAILEETGGSPSRASLTGKNPTYYGLLQWDKERLPQRHTGMKALDYLILNIVDSVTDVNSPNWTHGGKGTGFNNAQEAYDTFWGKQLTKRLIPKLYNLRDNDRNKVSQAFTDGYSRPENRSIDVPRRALSAKLIELARKK